jgi:hypothetical protein
MILWVDPVIAYLQKEEKLEKVKEGRGGKGRGGEGRGREGKEGNAGGGEGRVYLLDMWPNGPHVQWLPVHESPHTHIGWPCLLWFFTVSFFPALNWGSEYLPL